MLFPYGRLHSVVRGDVVVHPRFKLVPLGRVQAESRPALGVGNVARCNPVDDELRQLNQTLTLTVAIGFAEAGNELGGGLVLQQ